MRLIDRFAPVLRRVLELKHALEASSERALARTIDEPASQVFADLGDRLRDIEIAAVREGQVQERDVVLARKAVIAWIDESIGWYAARMGSTRKLQKTFHDSERFGDEFYDWIPDIGRERPEVAEVFLTVIGLGFRGKLNPLEKAQELESVKATLIQNLDRGLIPFENIRGGADMPTHITAQPYSLRDPEPVRKSNLLKWLLIGLAALVALLLIGFAVWWAIQPPNIDEIRQGVRDAVPEIDCAAFDVEISDSADVVVSGRFKDQSDVDAVVRAVAAVEGVGAVTEERIDLSPWPYCRLRNLAEDTTVMTHEGAAAPSIGLDKGTRPYRVGERIVITVANADRAGHLFVVYMNVEGNILHLLPWSRVPDNAVTPGQSIDFGVPEGVSGTRDNPPLTVRRSESGQLGQGMILTLWSETPIFSGPREDLSDVESLVQNIRDAMLGREPGSVHSSYRIIELSE